MALPFNLNAKILPNDVFFGIFNLCIFSLSKCQGIATENICQNVYIVEEKKRETKLDFEL